ncbi:hypothetical protein OJAV_G00199320 [Oryzias javanicus]|uniref:Ig-like domain-containing protein n=1 Tax=Oryzias javanicus TaxID=123683 RepID=A0A437C8B0_ORYJA|nr:hypothetical protein OJAV_G00199320 [Oryzias javanicus]
MLKSFFGVQNRNKSVSHVKLPVLQLFACGFAATGQDCTSIYDFRISVGLKEASMFVNMLTTIMVLFAPVFSGAVPCPNPAEILIEAPESLEALAGTCLQIQCTFKTIKGIKVQTTEKTGGVWIKNDPKFGNNPQNVVYNSTKRDNKIPITFIGNLSQSNCTTVLGNVQVDYKGKYYFRVEDELLTATASCHPVQITVKDSAWSPSIEIPADLKEEESVTVTCSSYTPCPQSPPELTWNLSNSQRKMEKHKDGSFTTKIQETITLSETHHGFTIKCFAKYPVNEGKDVKMAETQQTLNVSRAPKDASLFRSASGLGSVIGGIVGVILLICLVVLIWWLKSKRLSVNQTHVGKCHHPTQSLGEENAAPNQDVHYGEIDFSKMNLSHSPQKTTDQHCVVYSQITVGQSGNTRTNEDIYSLVNR